ncbi:RING finger protein nhl-1-like isoform X2 [Ornithodoros turicata]|uniref:RING finger protein nhl-1-like isoform X2 n=1 Tax=Ornithodoros turicata TaxID=34597 RepID=UPI003139A7A8
MTIKGKVFCRRSSGPSTPTATRRHVRKTITLRIPQPKLVHFNKMDVRTYNVPFSNPVANDYRSHLNHPVATTSTSTSTTSHQPATSSAPPLPPSTAPPTANPSAAPTLGQPSLSTITTSVQDAVSVQISPPVPIPSLDTKLDAQKQSITVLSSKGTETLKEMVQCPICLDRLHRPKMLPCQHAFCFLCLQNSVMSADITKLRCAKCRTEVPLPQEGISGFPSSIHLQNILDLLESDYASMDELLQCSTCQTMSTTVYCEHCKLSYCALCLARHVEDMAKQLSHITEQLEATVDKVGQRYKEFEEVQSALQSKIKEETEMRISTLRDSERQLLERLEAARICEEATCHDLTERVKNTAAATRTLAKEGLDSIKDPNEKVRAFMRLHREAGDLLSESVTNGNTEVSFDPSSFSVTIRSPSEPTEKDVEFVNLSSSPPVPFIPSLMGNSTNAAPLENSPATVTQQQREAQDQLADAQSRAYRTKSFLPKSRLGIGLVQRPSGVAVSPWSSEIFVVSMDNHKVFTFDYHTGRFLRSFGSRGHREGEFLCPFGIALSPIEEEILITDKWKHCIHVFDKEGNFLRQIGMKGRSAGHFRSPESICVDSNGRIYVCDTCNHRIQVLDHEGIFLHEIGTRVLDDRSRSMFQEPTGIAVTQDARRVVICDFGSHRVHVFSTDGEHLFTFGQKGSQRGQYVHPECVAVDARGFILIGDSGNGRIQICRPDGRHVRTFGNKGSNHGQFSWISGIAVTSNNEIVVSDFKNHSVQVF